MGGGDQNALDFCTAASLPFFAVVAWGFTATNRSTAKAVVGAVWWGVCFAPGLVFPMTMVVGPSALIFGYVLVPLWAVPAILAFAIAGAAVPGSRRIAVVAALAVSGLVAPAVYERATRPLADLLIYLRPDATREDVEHIWYDVLGHQDGPLSVPIEGALRVGYSWNNGPTIRVAFPAGTSRSRRRQVRDSLLDVPVVNRVVDADHLSRVPASHEGSLPTKMFPDVTAGP